MLLSSIKIIFITSAILFSFLIMIHKKFTTKIKDNVKISHFVAFIAFSLVLYVLGAIALSVATGGIKFKMMMIFFALVPFIVGKLATYQKVKLYSFIQISIMLISATVICLK